MGTTPGPGSPRAWTPVFVLLVGLVATGLGTVYVKHASDSKRRVRFENAARLTVQHINSQLETYIALLNGAQGFFAASDEVSLEDFRRYVHHLELKSRYPGIQGIGFSKRFPAGQKEDLVARMHQQGLQDFHVWPEHERPEYHSIVYLEPLDWRNRRAIGYDMFTEPVRRAAMEQARDTARPAASGKVQLVQETNEAPQAGFLIYVPVYSQGVTPKTLAERRARLEGFVYSPFRSDDLLVSILSNQPQLRVAVEFFDSAIGPENLLHDSRRFWPSDDRLTLANLFHTADLQIAGRTFVVRVTPGAGFGSGWEGELPLVILLGGATVSLLLYSSTASLAKARTAAERVAAELRRNEETRARRTRHLALRADVSLALTAPDVPICEVLQRCAQAAVRHLRVALVHIWTARPGEDVLELQASAGLYTYVEGAHARIRIGEFNIGRIARDRVPYVTADMPHDPAIPDHDWARREGLVAFAGFPLLVENRLLGVMGLFARTPFSEDTVDAVQAMADLLAQGIERRRAEEALRSSEERLRAIFDQAAAGIALADADGRFEEVNARFCEIVGLPAEALLTRSWPELIHPEDANRHASLWRRLLTGEINTVYVEIRCLCQGRITWLALSMSAVRDMAGRPVHTINVCRDITARKRAEQTVLDQKRELEDFVSIVAHDLKHPVVSVQGLLGLIRQDAAPLLDESSRESLEMALAECNRMKDIIGQLAHIARIGSGDVRMERVRLPALLNDSIRRFKRLINQKNVEVSIEAPDVAVMLARSQIEEALDNLIDNALQYGCSGGKPRLCLRCTTEPAAVAISVADNGPGIDPRFHKRVFEMFRRLNPEGPVRGTGVGLTAVQRLIRRIGGTVILESKINCGATFTLHVPVQFLPEPERPAKS